MTKTEGLLYPPFTIPPCRSVLALLRLRVSIQWVSIQASAAPNDIKASMASSTIPETTFGGIRKNRSGILQFVTESKLTNELNSYSVESWLALSDKCPELPAWLLRFPGLKSKYFRPTRKHFHPASKGFRLRLERFRTCQKAFRLGFHRK